MSANQTSLSREEWQEWANSLLSLRYGPTDYQRFPDHDRGDAGLEGFTLTDGHAYQAYGCDEPVSVKIRYEKQRDKMTEDIGKFITNHRVFMKLFGTVRITRWALFVPRCDSKQLQAHARVKTTEVIQAALPYVADTFHVAVCEECDFLVEREHLLNGGVRQVKVEAGEASPQEIDKWAIDNDGLTAVLNDKLGRMPSLATNQLRKRMHDRVLSWYIEGQEVLSQLREHPELYEKAIKVKAHREKFLIDWALSSNAPTDIIGAAAENMVTTLKEQVRQLHSFSIESLAYEAVADWLLRCPLDFPELASHGQ